MQAWEYIIVGGDWATGERYCPRWWNGREMADWQQGPVMPFYIAKVGAEGWEMVNFWNPPNMPAWAGPAMVVFKRPKQA